MKEVKTQVSYTVIVVEDMVVVVVVIVVTETVDIISNLEILNDPRSIYEMYVK